MEKIEQLTPEQEASLVDFRRKWIALALRDDWDEEAARAAVPGVYRAAGRGRPARTFCLRSPREAFFTIVALRGLPQTRGGVRKRICEESNLDDDRDPHGPSQEERGGDLVQREIGEHVREVVKPAVWDALSAAVDAELVRPQPRSVWREILESVVTNVENRPVELVPPPEAGDGDENLSWNSRLCRNPEYSPCAGAGLNEMEAVNDFMDIHFGQSRDTRPLRRLAESGAFRWWLYPGACVLCAPPKMHFRSRSLDSEPFVLHRDGGPAVEWPDGFALWFLDGVQVPRWLAETPEAAIDPHRILEIQNVQVRREFIRKVGIERIVNALGATVVDERSFVNDTGRHAYQLLDMSISWHRWRYLRMENPSLPGTYHLEGVPRDLDTVQAAILWRAGIREDQVDEEGSNWYQQGDVVMIPRGATKFRPFPKVLT